MTKRKFRTLEEMVNRPWCYYCERDFEDLSTLVDHQKSKHFKCHCCSRRLNTAGGVRVHMQQVHKETLTHIKDCINDERANPDIEIFGMEGVPEDLKEEFRQKMTAMWFESPAAAQAKEAEARAKAQANKKARIEETPEELKARQKALIARKRAERAAKANGQSTPNAASAATDASTPLDDPTSTAGASPSNGYNPQSAPFEGAPLGRDASNSPFQHMPTVGYGAPPQGYPAYGAPQPQYPMAGSPIAPQGFAPYPQPPMGPGYAGYGVPPANGYAPQFPPSISPPAHMSRGPHFQQHQQPQPAQAFPQGPYPAARNPPPASASPTIPGLPPRPTFDSPNLSKEQMASMHTPTQPNQPAPFGAPNQGAAFGAPNYGHPPAGPYGAPNHHGGHQMHKQPQHALRPHSQAQNTQPPVQDDVQQLIDSVTGQAAAGNATVQGAAPTSSTPSAVQSAPSASKPHETATPEASAEPKKTGKVALKTLLVYKDKFLSPEEKMAKFSKYAVDLTEINKPQMVLGEGGDAVTGSLGETVRDPQD